MARTVKRLGYSRGGYWVRFSDGEASQARCFGVNLISDDFDAECKRTRKERDKFIRGWLAGKPSFTLTN